MKTSEDMMHLVTPGANYHTAYSSYLTLKHIKQSRSYLLLVHLLMNVAHIFDTSKVVGVCVCVFVCKAAKR